MPVLLPPQLPGWFGQASPHAPHRPPPQNLCEEGVKGGVLVNIERVVTYMLPLEAFATVIKIFDWQKPLDCSLLKLLIA